MILKNRFVLRLLTTASFLLIMQLSTSFKMGVKYDPNIVRIINTNYGEMDFCTIRMSRKDDKIRVKYFATMLNNQTVHTRFQRWKPNKNLIVACAGTYFSKPSEGGGPVGLCVDEGVIVNRNSDLSFHGLVVVYASGGIQVVNLKNSIFKTIVNGVVTEYDIKNEYGKNLFINWAKSSRATVFQTNLLAENNINLVSPTAISSSKTPLAARRVLIVTKGLNGVEYHSIVYTRKNVSLYEFTNNLLAFMKSSQQMVEVKFILNLDTGAQNWIETYDSNGGLIKDGECLYSHFTENPVNLLVYSFEQ